MTVVQGLRTHLLGNADLLALVAARTFPGWLPEKVDLSSGRVAIVLTLVDDLGSFHLRGPDASSKARWQVDCWAQTHDAVIQAGRLCRWRLNGFHGVWSDGLSPPSTIRVQLIEKFDEHVIPEPEISGGLYRHSADYFITYASSEDQLLT